MTTQFISERDIIEKPADKDTNLTMLAHSVVSELDKDGFDVRVKICDDTVRLSIYSAEYGNSRITMMYSPSFVIDDNVIIMSDDVTNEHDEFYVNSENLLRDIIVWIEGGYFY